MALSLRQKLPRLAPCMARHMSDLLYHDNRELAGTRELVGHGKNGMHNYYDGHDCPLPAIRFRPEDAQSKVR